MKLLFAAITTAGIAAITFICVKGNSHSISCREFLAGYGWETEPQCTDKAEVYIPLTFDEVYNNYNILQKEADLDLLPFRGMTGIRYTFIVSNYPTDTGETVYADVICVNNTPVAGDIMTVSMDGFMHSLKKP